MKRSGRRHTVSSIIRLGNKCVCVDIRMLFFVVMFCDTLRIGSKVPTIDTHRPQDLILRMHATFATAICILFDLFALNVSNASCVVLGHGKRSRCIDSRYLIRTCSLTTSSKSTFRPCSLSLNSFILTPIDLHAQRPSTRLSILRTLTIYCFNCLVVIIDNHHNMGDK